MGRKKAGKSGRRRKGTFTLQQLQPPGYEEWIKVASHATADAAANDPRLGERAVDLMSRLARLRPFYRGPIPTQAVRLDMALDTGSIPLCGEGKARCRLPSRTSRLRWASPSPPATSGERSISSILPVPCLVEETDDGVPLVRIVSQPPRSPGDPWIFQGSPETCLCRRPASLHSPATWHPVSSPRWPSSGVTCPKATEARVEEFARHKDVGSVERARELFAAVAELTEVKGCSACPSAHICTRPERAGATR